MSLATKRHALLALAITCFAITVYATEHVVTAAGFGVLLGYTIGIMYPHPTEDEA